jgi:hypothetical protein
MAENDAADVDRLAALLRPVPLLDFITHVCQWLQDAHDAAADLQPLRKNNHRSNWNNSTSFGTDRHQYLLNTAESLNVDMPEMEVAADFQSVLLKLDRVGIYQFHMPSGPRGSVGDASDLRRQLLSLSEDDALFSRPDAWLRGRELLLLPWTGTEDGGLTDTWAGQGLLDDNHISWQWVVRLQDIAEGGYGHPGHLVPAAQADLFGPDAFDQPQPALPLAPRAEPRHGTTS